MNVIFDVDGVLIEGWPSDPGVRHSWVETIEQELGIDLAAFERLLFTEKRTQFGSLMDACALGQEDLKKCLPPLLPEMSFAGTVDELLDFWFEQDSNISNSVFEAIDILKQSDEIELYIATTQEHHRASFLWNQLNFSAHFTAMFYSAKIGYVKTDPLFFAAVNAELGIEGNDNPIFFDDRQKVISTALQAGWDATLFRSVEDILEHPRLIRFFN